MSRNHKKALLEGQVKGQRVREAHGGDPAGPQLLWLTLDTGVGMFITLRERGEDPADVGSASVHFPPVFRDLLCQISIGGMGTVKLHVQSWGHQISWELVISPNELYPLEVNRLHEFGPDLSSSESPLK